MRLRFGSLAARFAGLTGLAGLAAFPSAGLAAGLQADYGIWLAGLPIGTADVKSSFDGERYTISLQARFTGLAGMITGGKGAANASGQVSGTRVVPSAFAIVSRNSKESRSVRMGLRSGSVSAVSIEPPIDDKPDRVPVEEAHKRGVVDPVSALIMPAKGSATDPDNCNRTIPVFDGASRFDVDLTYSETKTVAKPGYSGPVLVCKARWKPISGHRPARSAVKFMEDNDDMAVWLAPMEGNRVLLPLRIEVRTQIGLSVVEASSLSFDGKPAGRRSARAGD